MALIKPTPGACYRDCWQLAMLDESRAYTLVHGYPRLTRGPDAGRKSGHAWLEFVDHDGVHYCLDHLAQDTPFIRVLYYHVGQIDPAECRYYSPLAAALLGRLYHTAGPWNPPPADALFAERATTTPYFGVTHDRDGDREYQPRRRSADRCAGRARPIVQRPHARA